MTVRPASPPITTNHSTPTTKLAVVAIIALGVSIAAQIVYPLVTGSVRDAATVVVLCAAAIAMVADAARRSGAVRGAVVISTVSAIVFTAELVGTRTGFPFGHYAYAQDRIGPSIGTVPILITAAWFVGAYSVWRVAVYVAPHRPVLRVIAAVVAMVGWDLYLDPQMVAAGLWSWDQRDAGLPGIEQIPLTNYAGWALLSLVVFTVLSALDPPSRVPGPAAPGAVPVIGLTWFVWTWLGSAVAQLLFLEHGALRSGVAYAVVAMAVLGVPGLAKSTGCRRR